LGFFKGTLPLNSHRLLFKHFSPETSPTSFYSPQLRRSLEVDKDKKNQMVFLTLWRTCLKPKKTNSKTKAKTSIEQAKVSGKEAIAATKSKIKSREQSAFGCRRTKRLRPKTRLLFDHQG